MRLAEKRVTDWIRAHLEYTCGLEQRVIPLDEVRAHVAQRFDPTLEAQCHAALAMGYLRYESVTGRDPRYLDWLLARLSCYERTGIRDYLVDVINFARLEWETPSLEGTRYLGGDDNGRRSNALGHASVCAERDSTRLASDAAHERPRTCYLRGVRRVGTSGAIVRAVVSRSTASGAFMSAPKKRVRIPAWVDFALGFFWLWCIAFISVCAWRLWSAP